MEKRKQSIYMKQSGSKKNPTTTSLINNIHQLPIKKVTESIIPHFDVSKKKKKKIRRKCLLRHI
jgi:hypothetical protein